MKFNLEELHTYLSVTNEIRQSLRLPHNHINVLPVLMDSLGENCRTYFEIGTYQGGSIISSMRFNGKCKFYGMDFFGKGKDDEWATRWGNQSALDNLTLDLVSKNIEVLNVNNQDFELIQADSQDSDTIKLINMRFSNEVDVLFIDGDHSFEGVCNDFNNYKGLVRQEGYIVFDDYGFLSDVRMAVDSVDKEGFEIIGRLPLVPGNDYVDELDKQMNACFIIKKNK